VFFAWTVALRKILIFDNLRKMNVILVDWCCICKRIMEVSFFELSFKELIKKKIMEVAFLVVWGCMVYASKCERVIGDQEGTIGIP